MMRSYGSPRCRNSESGFTLIELLIVIAILAILSAGSLTFFTLPFREQRIAMNDSAYRSGTAAAFARMVEDLHNADRYETSATGSLNIWPVGADHYAEYRTEKGQLRRQLHGISSGVDGPGILLADNVRSFRVTPSADRKLLTAELEVSLSTLGQVTVETQRISIATGTAWAGTKRPL